MDPRSSYLTSLYLWALFSVGVASALELRALKISKLFNDHSPTTVNAFVSKFFRDRSVRNFSAFI